MAQRLSVLGFLLTVLILRNNWNRSLFSYQELDDGDYSRLLSFCWVILVVEWVGSTFIWAVLRLLYNREVVGYGAHSMVKSCLVWPSCLLALHVLQDTALALMQPKQD